MATSRMLLFYITIFIRIIEGYKCRLYLYTGINFGGYEHGPYDVGEQEPYGDPVFRSMRIYAEGYTCHVKAHSFCNPIGGAVVSDLTAAPFQMTDDAGAFTAECAVVSADATPKPTLHPSQTPTSSAAPTTSPTSSCLDYNNETSFDGNNEIREFNYKNIININNYYINKNTVLEFITSYDINYRNQLIECAVSDCIIQCHHTASCFKTNIEINNITNKTIILLCYDEYSCSSSSVTTQWSAATISMVNI
eukprot:172174_1